MRLIGHITVNMDTSSQAAFRRTDKDAEIAKLKEIAVKNRIPVTRVGFDVNGNTFVDCPSQSDCERL